MAQIFKYPINPETILELSKGAKILDVQVQYGTPVMWALVDARPTERRRFRSIPTGASFDPTGLEYIATFQLDGMVFHVFEDTNK